MPVGRSMSSLPVSRLTFAPWWPCGTDTAPARMERSTFATPVELTLRAADHHRLTVGDAGGGRVVGVDDDLDDLTEEVQLRVQVADLPARHEHE